MIPQVKSYLNYGTTYSAIEITSVEGEEIINTISAGKKKGEFVDLQFSQTNKVEDVSTTLGKNQHCFLILNTDKVLTKEVDFIENTSKLVARSFPSFSSQDFYYEVLRSGSKCFVSVCKKEYADGLIEDLSKKKIHVLGFQLAFNSIQRIVPVLDEFEIEISNKVLTTSKKNNILSYSENRRATQEYTIENIQVPSSHLLSLGGLFNYISNASTTSNGTEQNALLKKRFNELTFFRKGLPTAISFLLIILLINVLLFNSYFKEQQVLKEQVEVSKTQRDLLKQRTALVENKKKIVDNMLRSSTSKSSFYVNQIITVSPTTILFSRLEFQPLASSIRPDKIITYEESEISMAGESSDKEAFSDWITALEKLTWIEQVSVIGYSNTGSKDKFELKIRLVSYDTTE